MATTAERIDWLQETNNRISSGVLTPESLLDIEQQLVAPGVTVREYIEMSHNFREVEVIDGHYQFLYPEGEKSRLEITLKVLELKKQQDTLSQQGKPQNDPEVIEVNTWLEAIDWFIEPKSK